MTALASGRGRPLRFFGLLLGAWVTTRVAILAMPWADPSVAAPVPPQAWTPSPGAGQAQVARSGLPLRVVLPALPAQGPRPSLARFEKEILSRPLADKTATSANEALFAPGQTAAAGHNLLWMAAMAAMPLPAPVARLLENSGATAPAAVLPGGSRLASADGAASSGARWHFDGWLVYRGGDHSAPSPLSGVGPGLLGGSQAGAVVTYRLGRAEAAPALMVRLAGAPGEAGTPAAAEAAAGIRWRPFARLPAAIQGEVRVGRSGDGITRARPAALVVGGFDDADLPFGAKLRAYGAAGWVGGSFPTAFAEGHVVAAREVARFDLARLDAGLGTWGAIQRNVARLDAGPSVSLSFPAGGTAARLQVDYRRRLAGDAAPGDGIAVTLSTGF